MAMDAFQLLGLPRELDLDPAIVRARLQELSLTRHPDRGGDAVDYSQLVEAASILSSPARRWSHWAELEGWARRGHIVEMEPSMADEFHRVGELLARAREVAQAKTKAGSALAKAMVERKSMALFSELSEKISAISTREDALLARAKVGLTATEAGKLSGDLACLARWLKELREAASSLA